MRRRIRADSMPRGPIDFDAVREIGLALPGVEENTAYGLPALKVQGKLLASVPANRSAEPGSTRPESLRWVVNSEHLDGLVRGEYDCYR